MAEIILQIGHFAPIPVDQRCDNGPGKHGCDSHEARLSLHPFDVLLRWLGCFVRFGVFQQAKICGVQSLEFKEHGMPLVVTAFVINLALNVALTEPVFVEDNGFCGNRHILKRLVVCRASRRA